MSLLQRETPGNIARNPLHASHGRERGGHAWCVSLLVAATLLAFGRMTTNEFVSWDDPGTINSPVLRDQGIGYFWLHPHMDIYIPLTYTVWGLLRPAALIQTPAGPPQLNPWIFHGASVLFHLLAALVVYAILCDLLKGLPRNRWPACFGAMLFALHPVQVEAVAWASGLKDVLAGLLALTAIWQYIRYAQADVNAPATAEDRAKSPGAARWHYAMATLAFVAAMLAKPNAALTPLIAFVIDYWLLRRSARRTFASLAAWFVLAIPILVIARLAQPSPSTLPVALWQRPLIAGNSICFYLWKLIWPRKLGIDYGWRPEWLVVQEWFYAIWIIPCALGLLLWLGRKKYPQIWVAAIIFIIAPLPTLGFITYEFQGISDVADHYLYVAMLGPALALAWMLVRLPLWITSRSTHDSRRDADRPAHTPRGLILAGVYAPAAIALSTLAILASIQGQFWSNDLTLWTHTLAVNPTSCLAQTYLGYIAGDDGDTDEALRHYHAAMHDNPRVLHPWTAAIKALRKSGRIDQEDAEGARLMPALHAMPPEARFAAIDLFFDLAYDMDEAGRFDRAIVYSRQMRSLLAGAPGTHETQVEQRAAQLIEQNAAAHHRLPRLDRQLPHPAAAMPD